MLKKKNTGMQKRAIKVFMQHRDKQIPEKNDFLRTAVTPVGYTPGCKRMGISNEWFIALNSSNTELIINKDTSKNCIIDFYDKGIILKDGRKLQVDVIVFATGYEVSKITTGFDAIGIDNTSLCQLWNSEYGPYCYKGVTTNKFPNLFMILGPGSGVGSNSFLVSIEIGCDYVIKCIYDIILNGWKSVEIKKEIEQEYNKKMDERMKEMIWTQNERSWYKLKNGRVHALFGWGMFKFWWYLKYPVWSEYNILK